MGSFSSRGTQLLSLLVLLIAARASADEPLPAPSVCTERGAVVTVIVRKRELWLCEDGMAVRTFHVALGRGGIDKHRKGDGRTPVGSYALGLPRPSSQYGVFIPIVYPNADQAAQGFTGSEVGSHGPPRGLSEPEYPTTAVDWTQGCIATGTDEEVGAIAEFVRARRPRVVIR